MVVIFLLVLEHDLLYLLFTYFILLSVSHWWLWAFAETFILPFNEFHRLDDFLVLVLLWNVWPTCDISLDLRTIGWINQVVGNLFYCLRKLISLAQTASICVLVSPSEALVIVWLFGKNKLPCEVTHPLRWVDMCCRNRLCHYSWRMLIRWLLLINDFNV